MENCGCFGRRWKTIINYLEIALSGQEKFSKLSLKIPLFINMCQIFGVKTNYSYTNQFVKLKENAAKTNIF